MYIDYILVNMGGFKIPKVIGYKNVEHLRHRLAEYGAVFMKTEEAINLQKANKIVYYSLPLSSELFEQSKKRIHRIRSK